MSVKGEVFFQFKPRLNEILARIWTVANSLLSVHSIMSHALSSPHYACENLSSLQELFHFSFSDALVRHCFYSIWESLAYCPVITPLCAEHSQLGQMRGEQRRTERQVKKFSYFLTGFSSLRAARNWDQNSAISTFRCFKDSQFDQSHNRIP